MFSYKYIKYNFPGTLLIFLLPLLLIGCNSDDAKLGIEAKDTVDRICVSLEPMTMLGVDVTRAEEDENDSQDSDSDNWKYEEGITDQSILIPFPVEFNENSIIQVSQQTGNVEPFRFDDGIFNFQYMPGQVEDWDDDASFNFAGYEKTIPLEWNYIGKGGHWNGGFALYSLYFPVDNAIRRRMSQDGTFTYSVMEDQSTLENLHRSDILGAYHSAEKIFQRIRFRMFHLMTYVRIRLFVPLYEDTKHTGYREGALLSATLNNVTPEFQIEWSQVRNPDSEGPKVFPLSGDGEIKMYLHPLKDGKTEHPIVRIKYKDYLKDGYFDQGIEGDYDDVRVYDFSVIIPEQRGSKGEDGQESNFTKTKFLNFKFRTNSGADATYYFQENLSVNSSDSKLDMTQGVFQYMELYVPRVGNQLIPLGAYVNNWENKGGDMLLNEQK